MQKNVTQNSNARKSKIDKFDNTLKFLTSNKRKLQTGANICNTFDNSSTLSMWGGHDKSTEIHMKGVNNSQMCVCAQAHTHTNQCTQLHSLGFPDSITAWRHRNSFLRGLEAKSSTLKTAGVPASSQEGAGPLMGWVPSSSPVFCHCQASNSRQVQTQSPGHLSKTKTVKTQMAFSNNKKRLIVLCGE